MRYTLLMLFTLALAGPVRADFVFIEDELDVLPPVVQANAPAAELPAEASAPPAPLPVEAEAPASVSPAVSTPITEPAAASTSVSPVRPPVPVAQGLAAAALPEPPPEPAPQPPPLPQPVVAVGEEVVEEITLSSEAAVGTVPVADPLVATVVTAVPSHQAAFDVRAGETVRTAFQRWTESQGWTLRWQADFDLRIEADNLFAEDQLTEVVPLVLSAFRTPPGQKRLTATAYRGNRVLLIEGKVQP